MNYAKHVFVFILVLVAGFGSGRLFFTYNFNNHLAAANNEADALLTLTSSYVKLYGKLREDSQDYQMPVPAAFRAQAAEMFNKSYEGKIHTLAKMVGLPHSYVATPPFDHDMDNVLIAMAEKNDGSVFSGLLERDGNSIARTMYPSVATRNSCADCHNKIQNSSNRWKRGDVMGAYVIERSVQAAKERYEFFAYLVGALVTLTSLCLLFAFKLNRDLTRKAAELKSLANKDPLTGCLNRRALDASIENISVDVKTNAALLLLDIDHFKKINDRWGHDVGDQVLVWFAETVRSVLRQDDVLARVGGEEFTVYLLGTSEQTARVIADRVCETVAAAQLEFGAARFQVTVSIGGVHTGRVPHQSIDLYNKVADKFLYLAKARGRNRAVWSVSP